MLTARARAQFRTEAWIWSAPARRALSEVWGAEAVGDRLDQAVELAAGLLKLAALEVDREFGCVWWPVADDDNAGCNADTGLQVSTGLQLAHRLDQL